MGLRVAIGRLSHETNTFCLPTPLEDFRRHSGQDVLAINSGVRSYLGGMIEASSRLGISLVPTYDAGATPSGTIRREAFEAMLHELCRSIQEAMPLDGVCLALHGAGVAEGYDDIETATLRAVRQVIGPQIPLVATLDLHGNLYPQMLSYATALFGVHEYPHIDSFERGAEAMDCVYRCAMGHLRPVMALVNLPLITPTATSFLEPVRSINAACHEAARMPGIMDVAFFHGFAYTDIPRVGASVMVVAECDMDLAQRVANDVAELVWDRRHEFDRHLLSAREAIDLARAARNDEGGPIVINDTSDNPGAGGPGDGTYLLQAMIDAGLERAAFGFMVDPDTVRQAAEAGVGSRLRVRLGGRTFPLNGPPIEGEAYVKGLSDGRFRQSSPMGRGREVDLGPMARLQIGGLDVLVSSVREQTLDDEVFLLNGLDIRDYDIVALKSSQHFRAGFQDIARRIVTADTPGISSCNLRNIPYTRVLRPVAPLDVDADFTARHVG